MTTYLCRIVASDKPEHSVIQTRLVEAKTAAKALAHVSASHITVEKATSAQCVELGAAGVKIEIIDGLKVAV